MILLQWTWTLRFGPYARANLAASPGVVVLPLVAALASGVYARLLGASLVGVVGTALVVLVVTAALLAWTFARSLRRLRSATQAQTQAYALTTDALEIRLGQDRASVPLSELTEVRAGASWVALRRRALRTRLVLFFDDPALVPQARAIIEQHGAVSRA